MLFRSLIVNVETQIDQELYNIPVKNQLPKEPLEFIDTINDMDPPRAYDQTLITQGLSNLPIHLDQQINFLQNAFFDKKKLSQLTGKFYAKLTTDLAREKIGINNLPKALLFKVFSIKKAISTTVPILTNPENEFSVIKFYHILFKTKKRYVDDLRLSIDNLDALKESLLRTKRNIFDQVGHFFGIATTNDLTDFQSAMVIDRENIKQMSTQIVDFKKNEQNMMAYLEKVKMTLKDVIDNEGTLKSSFNQFIMNGRPIMLSQVIQDIIEYNKINEYMAHILHDTLLKLLFLQTELAKIISFIDKQHTHVIPTSIAALYSHEQMEIATCKTTKESSKLSSECTIPKIEHIEKLAIHSLPLYINNTFMKIKHSQIGRAHV